jgi:hypothetical protein
MKKNYSLLIFFGIFLIVSFFYIFVPFDGSGKMINGIIYHVASFLIMGFGIYAVRQFGIGSKHGKALAFLTAGISLWVIGDLLYMVTEDILQKQAFPSYIDVIYLLGYPVVLVGLYIEIKSPMLRDVFSRQQKLAFPGVFLLLATLYIFFIYAPASGNTFAENVIMILYNIGDIVLIFYSLSVLAIANQYRQGSFFESWIFVFAGLIIIFIADILYALYFNEYDLGNFYYIIIDLTYFLGYLSISYAFYTFSRHISCAQNKIRAEILKN